jgi:hypothetical protein
MKKSTKRLIAASFGLTIIVSSYAKAGFENEYIAASDEYALASVSTKASP